MRERARARERVGERAAQPGAPPAQELASAAHRVDLAVVREEPERLRERPGRMRVRRVALVVDGVADRDVGAQVGIEGADPGARDEALVDDRARRRRRDREVDDAGLERVGFHPPAREQEMAVEAAVAERAVAPIRRTPGASPAVDARDADPRASGSTGTSRWPIERRPCAASAFSTIARACAAASGSAGRNRLTTPGPTLEPGREEAEQRPLERQEHAGPVARLAVSGERATMAERREAGERERQHAVALVRARRRDEADATRVVLEPRVVQRDSARRRPHGGSTAEGFAWGRRSGSLTRSTTSPRKGGISGLPTLDLDQVGGQRRPSTD